MLDNLILNYVNPTDNKWYEVGPFNEENEALVARDADLYPSINFFLTKEVISCDVWTEQPVRPTN